MANWNDTDQRQGFGSVPRAGDAVARQETFDAGLRAVSMATSPVSNTPEAM